MAKKKSFKRSYKKKPVIPVHRRKGFWLAMILPILFVAIAYLFIFSSIFRVNEIRVIGADTIDPEEMRLVVENEIVSSVAFFKSKSIFLISGPGIVDSLTNAFPELRSVRVKKSFLNSVSVTVVERKATASWCRQPEECFLIDKEGVIFKEVSDTGRLAIIRGGDEDASLSETPISSEEMGFIMDTWREVRDVIDLIVFDVTNPDLVVQTSEGWRVRFTFTESARAQAEKLVLALENKIPEDKRAELDYVDVRFENRVYFKYKDR